MSHFVPFPLMSFHMKCPLSFIYTSNIPKTYLSASEIMNVVTISIMLVLCIANANAQGGIVCFRGDGTGDPEECFEDYEDEEGNVFPIAAQDFSCHTVR